MLFNVVSGHTTPHSVILTVILPLFPIPEWHLISNLPLKTFSLQNTFMIHHHQSLNGFTSCTCFRTLPVVYAVTLLLLIAYVKGSYYSQVPPSAAHLCLYSDGTKVTEEFFQMLPDNTELVLLSREQHWSGGGDPTVIIYMSQIRHKKHRQCFCLTCICFIISFREHQQVTVCRYSQRCHH